MSDKESTAEDRQTIKAQAQEALRRGEFDLAEQLLAQGNIDLEEVTQKLRIYQAELEIQNTELQETQWQVQQALDRYTAFFLGIPIAAVVVDRHGLILEANTHAQKLFGLSGQHLRRHFLRRLMLKEHERQLHQALVQAGESGHYIVEKITFLDANEEQFTGELHVARLPGRDGREHDFVCAIVDLTEHIRHELEITLAHEELRESEARYRILADYSPVWDYWLGDDGQYRYVSPGCESISGCPPEQFMQDPKLMDRIMMPSDLSRWIAHQEDIRHDASELPHRCLEFRIRHANGEVRWIEHECQPVISLDGAHQGRRGVNRDITERKQAELQLAQVSMLYATLSAVNQAIVRIEDEQLLLDNLTRIAVDYGRFNACVISLCPKPGADPVPRSFNGLTPQQCRSIPLEEAWQAINQQPYVYAHRDDPEAPPQWRAWARRNGIHTFGHYPLIREYRLVGMASFMSDSPDSFTPQIDRLVQDITEDFSYALQHLALEQKRRTTEAALQESESRYRSLFENSHSVMLLVDPQEERIVDANPGACQFYGCTRHPLLNRALADIEQREPSPEPAQKLNPGAEYYRATHCLANGDLRQVEVYTGLIQVEGQTLRHAVVHDITDRIRSEARLRLADQVFQAAAEGIVVTDVGQRIIAINPAFTQITGYTEADVAGRTPAMLKSGKQDAAFYKAMMQSLQTTGSWRGELWNRRKDGTLYPEWLTISAVRDDQGQITHYVGIFSDIGPVKEAQRQLELMAHFDPLTGLANRTLFRDRLTHSLRRVERSGKGLALLFIDLDRFKTINDTLGHSLGDQLLQTVAKRMADNVRASDTLARLGGDEFVLLLENDASMQNIQTLCQKILGVLTDPVTLDEHEVIVTASIGVALYPEDGEDADTLLKHADMAMYEAKNTGRNDYHFFTPNLSQGVLERLKMESALRGASQRGELVLHYQPQVNLQTRQLVGVEALVRWQHPTLGLVSPGTFICLAEDMGIISEIGTWVLREACRQMNQWRQDGIHLPQVAVNLSVQQLERDNLVSQVKMALQDYQLPAECLELEVTESLIMRAPERTQSVLRELKTLGIKIAVDDFGIGYSCLSYLKRLPLDRIKIDQSFVQDVGADNNDETIVRAIIGLSRSLGLETVAEGVESECQRQFLIQEGCRIGQGYLFSKPLTVDALIAQWASTAHHGQGAD
ncbi:PAS domain S-box-containing protein/diguanylate cyclase (GGDEF) domain-containing protein [Ectothiorhodospira magna]|uniref:cyclic-guanylate-specific phosphodiesterase n=1 Tax=Ectothiorhodospira magna TaxID=867345 RepID=A0A1H9EFJ9_9GAMM|nr:EAL domain-containing protein [Ectothiorhodospira magna]SEQ24405.1 PAS domain S-box-containing protein/diguanylate cyclase (GGDEF) domain-containing protein [Ectothiorhodospira magna]